MTISISIALLTLPFQNDSDDCEAHISHSFTLAQNGFNFNAYVLYRQERNNYGSVYFSGVLENGNETYHLSQYINLHYFQIGENKYNVSIKKIKKVGFDDVPSDLVTLLYEVIGLSGDIPVYIYNRNKNYITTGTVISPLMSCVIVN